MAYQPLALYDLNVAQNRGLLRVLCKIGSEVAAAMGPVMVRIDVANWYRVMKGYGNRKLGALGDHLKHVTFWLPPWHSWKHLNALVWNTLSPGMHDFVFALPYELLRALAKLFCG